MISIDSYNIVDQDFVFFLFIRTAMKPAMFLLELCILLKYFNHYNFIIIYLVFVVL